MPERSLIRRVTDAGLGMTWGEDDAAWRLYSPDETLVGMIVIRDSRITYAELGGRVFAFWPTRLYDHDLAAFYAALTELETKL